MAATLLLASNRITHSVRVQERQAEPSGGLRFGLPGPSGMVPFTSSVVVSMIEIELDFVLVT